MIFFPFVVLLTIFVVRYTIYKNSTYNAITGYSYFSVRFNKGRYGEYLTYRKLKEYEASGAKFLFNTYVPKKDGTTTEIDIMMISTAGIFVFESKNFSGWIFGREHQQQWCQVLPRGRNRSQKEHFYNPIKQNQAHIKHLKSLLGDNVPMWSVIVFSDRCTLKNIELDTFDIQVIYRCNVASTVSNIYHSAHPVLLSLDEIEAIHRKLSVYTLSNGADSSKHINDILSPSPKVKTNTHSKPQTSSTHTKSTPHRSAQNQETNDSFRPCPCCEGHLVLRTAKQRPNAGNQFYGCSNFPKCRYIENIPN